MVKRAQNFNEKLANLPDSSGVYLMYNTVGEIIYVGKARILKNRVRQYFNNSQKPPRTQAMVDSVADFSYIITLSEKDAFSLESNLIKKHKPKYNILLKDDKAAPYIHINMASDFPTLDVVRRLNFDKKTAKNERIFGPFIGIRASDVLSIIRSAYKIRSCPKRLPKRACLNYHIDLCLAPCENLVTKEQYFDALNNAIAFLSGKDDEAKLLLEEGMERATRREDFERAIDYRDQLALLKRLKERHVADLTSGESIDGIAAISNDERFFAAVNIIRGGKMMGVKTFSFAHASLDGALPSFMARYYDENEIPPQIILDSEAFLGNLEPLREYLSSKRGSAVTFTIAQKGAKKRISDMAKQNALEYMTLNAAKEERQKTMTIDAANRLRELLKIDSARLIECYDVSNLSGTDTVASRSVILNGLPERSLYRRYKMKTYQGSDDYSGIKEVISRRFSADSIEEEYPNLIVIDGGKGQLSAAREALGASKGSKIPLISLAKRDELIYLSWQEKPISLSKNDNALKLLQRLRDEAHRFAITFNRSLRTKKLDSDLLSIKGIGEKTRQKINDAIPYSQLKTLSAEEICQKAGINIDLAKRIENHFKGGNFGDSKS